MSNFKLTGINKVEMSISTLIDLLEIKLLYIEKEEEYDPSWNYPIEQTKKALDELKSYL
jgi:hypothetical protein